MGILSNTVTICHFRVVGELLSGDPLVDVAQSLLATHHFNSIDDTIDEASTGWVHLDDPKASSFANHLDCWRDGYLVFSLRRDERKVPAALLKEHLEKAYDAFLAENPGFTKVPKQKREDLKEQVRNRLLAKTLPTPKMHDVVWCTGSDIVTFTTISPKTVELLQEQFKRTFEGLRLVPFHPYERAMSCLDSTGQRLLTQANRANGDNYLELIKENQWIGTDFMLWLLYQTMNEASEYRINRPGPELEREPFVAYIDDKVVLIGEGEGGAQMITVNGPQDRFAEVKSALQGRKRVSEATIHLQTAGDEKWCLTLKGEMFHFAGFSSPAVKIEKDNTVNEQMEREAVFFERMLLLSKGLQLFHSLFSSFLRVRLSVDWPDVSTAIMAWIEES